MLLIRIKITFNIFKIMHENFETIPLSIKVVTLIFYHCLYFQVNDDDDATSKPEAMTQIPIYPSQGHYTENKIAIRKFITAFKENAYSN